MLGQFPVVTMVPVTNLQRAVDFYENRLGLEYFELPDEEVAGFYAGNGTQLMLYSRSTPTTAEHTIATWLVSDIYGVMDELRGRGVVFEKYNYPGLQTDADDIVQLGAAKAAWFKDTEGNILGITEA